MTACSLKQAASGFSSSSKYHFLNILYFLLGTFLTAPVLLIFALISIPAILYRFIISSLLSKLFWKSGFRKMVELGFTTAYAAEHLATLNGNKITSKNTILTRLVIEGRVPLEDCWKQVENGWLKERPNLQWYVDHWMGYAYWRQDFEFELKNHLKHGNLEEPVDVDEFTTELFEKLYNRQFLPKRSPWELHVIHGCRKDNQEVTLIVLRLHHVLGDGASVRRLLLEDFLGCSLKDLEKTMTQSLKPRRKNKADIFSQSLLLFTEGIRLLRDFGVISSFALWRANTRTKLHVEENGRQIFEMTGVLPMDKIKDIRAKFGVSFSGLMISAEAKAVAQFLGSGQRNLVLISPRPLLGSVEGKLSNHLTFGAYKLPGGPAMNPVSRLLEMEETYKRVNSSLFAPFIAPILVKLLSCHVTPIAKFGFKSQFGACLSNNWGPPFPLHFVGKNKVLDISGAVGLFDGASGLIVSVTGYNNQVRVQAVANESALSKQELGIFLDQIIEEINSLHEIQI